VWSPEGLLGGQWRRFRGLVPGTFLERILLTFICTSFFADLDGAWWGGEVYGGVDSLRFYRGGFSRSGD